MPPKVVKAVGQPHQTHHDRHNQNHFLYSGVQAGNTDSAASSRHHYSNPYATFSSSAASSSDPYYNRFVSRDGGRPVREESIEVTRVTAASSSFVNSAGAPFLRSFADSSHAAHSDPHNPHHSHPDPHYTYHTADSRHNLMGVSNGNDHNRHGGLYEEQQEGLYMYEGLPSPNPNSGVSVPLPAPPPDELVNLYTRPSSSSSSSLPKAAGHEYYATHTHSNNKGHHQREGGEGRGGATASIYERLSKQSTESAAFRVKATSATTSAGSAVAGSSPSRRRAGSSNAHTSGGARKRGDEAEKGSSGRGGGVGVGRRDPQRDRAGGADSSHYHQAVPLNNNHQSSSDIFSPLSMDGASLDVLVRYKTYVEGKLMPQFQNAIDKADRLQAALGKAKEENETLKSNLGESESTATRLRLVIDEERLQMNKTHAEHIAALKESHLNAIARLKEEADAFGKELAMAHADRAKMVQLERLLEMRDTENRKLRAALTAAVEEKNLSQQAARREEGNNSVAGLNSDTTGDASANSISTLVDSMISDAVSYLNALSTACRRGGFMSGPRGSEEGEEGDPFGGGTRAWRDNSSLRAIAKDLTDALTKGNNTGTSYSSNGTTVGSSTMPPPPPPAFVLSLMRRLVAGTAECMKKERACVASALGAIVTIHAKTIASINDREAEMHKIREVHRQRVEELERDFTEQMRLMQAQMASSQHAHQHQHHSSSPSAGYHLHGGKAHRALTALSNESEDPRAASSSAAAAPFLSSHVSPFSSGPHQQQRSQQGAARGTNEGGSVFGGAFEAWGGKSQQGISKGTHDTSSNNKNNPLLADNSNDIAFSYNNSNNIDKRPTRSCGTQTILDVNVLFPGVSFPSGAAGGVSSGGAASGGLLGPPMTTLASAGGGGGALVHHHHQHAHQPVELLTSEDIDGAAVARLVAELRAREEDNEVLLRENEALKDERRKHLYFMKMSNVSAQERAILAQGSVTDLLLF